MTNTRREPRYDFAFIDELDGRTFEVRVRFDGDDHSVWADVVQVLLIWPRTWPGKRQRDVTWICPSAQIQSWREQAFTERQAWIEEQREQDRAWDERDPY